MTKDRDKEFYNVLVKLGWSFSRSSGWLDRNMQPIDRAAVVAALPNITPEELAEWESVRSGGEPLDDETLAAIVEEENQLSIGGPHDIRLREYERAEVVFENGSFDGEVVLTSLQPSSDKHETPAETLAYSLCLLAPDGARSTPRLATAPSILVKLRS